MAVAVVLGRRDLEDVPPPRDRAPGPAGAARDLVIGKLAQERQLLFRPGAAVGPRGRAQAPCPRDPPAPPDLLRRAGEFAQQPRGRLRLEPVQPGRPFVEALDAQRLPPPPDGALAGAPPVADCQ